MTVEKVFRAAPEVEGKAIAEAKYGLAIYLGNPEMRKPRPATAKGSIFVFGRWNP